jgi:hypothetical protein
MENEIDKNNLFIQYFEDKSTSPSGLKALLGIPYIVDDLLAYLNPGKMNFCEMLFEQVKNEIYSKTIGGKTLIRTLSYVAGASVSENVLDENCIINSLSLINIASTNYSHVAQTIYWQTGRRIMMKAQVHLDKNKKIAGLLAQYFHTLIMIAEIKLEDLALQLLDSLDKNDYWISRIAYIVSSLRLAKNVRDKEKFHTLLKKLTVLFNEEQPGNIRYVAIVEAGPEIIMSLDAFNEPSEFVDVWHRCIVKAISILRSQGGYDSYANEWLKKRRYFSDNESDRTFFDQWLMETEFRAASLEARIAYRRNNLYQSQKKFEDALNILWNRNIPDYNNELSTKLEIERVKIIRDSKNKRELEKIWFEAKKRRHYMSRTTFGKILSNYIQVADPSEQHKLITDYHEYLENDARELCMSFYTLLLTASNSDRPDLESKFIEYAKKYALEIAPHLEVPLKCIKGEISYKEALKSCSHLMSKEGKTLCNQLMIEYKKGIVFNRYRLRIGSYKISSLLHYSDFNLIGLSLSEQSSGIVVLLIFAWIKKDTTLIRELIDRGKEGFRVPIFTSLCNELLDALNSDGLDSEKFRKCLDRLVFVTLF